VSGRPISFRMDLYNPLYVPRPTVEPELFASLRPVAYSGAMKRNSGGTSPEVIEEVEKLLEGREQARKAAPDSALLGGAGNGEVDEKQLRLFAEQWGSLPAAERARRLRDLTRNLPARYRATIEDYFRTLSDGERLGKDQKALAEKVEDLAKKMGGRLDL